MTHHHVGYNLSGDKPQGEIITYRTLDEAIAASHANQQDIAAGFDEPTVIVQDTDPDCQPGTSAWVTINDGQPNEFSYYCWVESECDCEEGESALLAVTRTELIERLEANDPNGVYSDEAAISEGAFHRPWTDDELRAEAAAQGIALPATP